MKIFISWSGERSKAVAVAFRNWLPIAFQYTRPWLSESDIKSGYRWSIEIARELQESEFGIFCVTPDNLTAPWLNFEAGAVAKSLEAGRAIPLLLDVEPGEMVGPLTQFQAAKLNYQGVLTLAKTINSSSTTPLAEDVFSNVFDATWQRLEGDLQKVPGAGSQKKTRSQADTLAEVHSEVRMLNERMRDIALGRPNYPHRLTSIEPLLRLVHNFSIRTRPDLALAILASGMKNEFPWIAEIVSIIRMSITARDSELRQSSCEMLLHGLKLINVSVIEEGITGTDRYIYETTRTMRNLVLRIMEAPVDDEFMKLFGD